MYSSDSILDLLNDHVHISSVTVYFPCTEPHSCLVSWCILSMWVCIGNVSQV